MKNEQLWIDVMVGMRDRASYLVNDADSDGRNDNWYARQMYGEQYEEIRNEYQDRKMGEPKIDGRFG